MEGVDPRLVVRIDYTNYRGERAWREILPRSLRFDRTVYHPQPQWLLTALDVAKGEERGFALLDIHQWLPPENQF